MKQPVDWEEDDLFELIRIGAEEDISRDWKEARALASAEGTKTQISKDVSAFANSNGGIVVYGLEEDGQPPHKAVALSPIDPVQFPPEWLENVILSRIKPPIQGLRIKPIHLAKHHPGKLTYVVYVPRSVTAHQASDKRYYRRREFQSEPMEDYEIRLAMHRTTWPTYKVTLLKRKPAPADGHYYFRAIVTNTSDLVARDVFLNLLIPAGLCGEDSNFMSEIYDDDGCKIEYKRLPAPQNTKSTLYPGDPLSIGFELGYLRLPTQTEARQCNVIVRVYDQFGRAHEGIFTVTLTTTPLQILREYTERPREPNNF